MGYENEEDDEDEEDDEEDEDEDNYEHEYEACLVGPRPLLADERRMRGETRQGAYGLLKR